MADTFVCSDCAQRWSQEPEPWRSEWNADGTYAGPGQGYFIGHTRQARNCPRCGCMYCKRAESD